MNLHVCLERGFGRRRTGGALKQYVSVRDNRMISVPLSLLTAPAFINAYNKEEGHKTPGE